MIELSAREESSLSALTAAVSDPSGLLARWRGSDLFAERESTGLSICLGDKNSPSVAMAVRRYEDSVHRPFPPLLAGVLAACNGLNIEETETGTVELTRESSVQNVWNGILSAAELESEEAQGGGFSGIRFATAYAEGRLILVDEGKHRGAVVFDDGKGAAVVVAPSLDTFILALVERGLSVEAVVGQSLNARGDTAGADEPPGQPFGTRPWWKVW